MDNYDQYNSAEVQKFISELQQKEATLLHKEAGAGLHADEMIQLEEIRELLYSPELLAVYPAIDVEDGWRSISEEIDVPLKVARLNPLRRYLTYAASVALLAGLGWFALRNSETDRTHSKTAQNYIEKHRATLILEDGTAIALDHKTRKKITDGTAVLSDSARAIRYQSATSPSGGYHTLEVPRGGEYRLIMSDGTEVWLNSETRLRYPVMTMPTGNRMVYLEEGEAYFKVTKNKRAPFMVNLNGMQVEVLGTSFNINTFHKKISTTLVEGRIRINREGRAPVYQVPGEQSNFDLLTREINRSEVDIYPYTSWKDGWLVFNDNSLEEVLEQIGRWYDYQVTFESPALKSLRFGGKLRKAKNITDVLSVIERSSEVKYRMSDKVIYIQSKQ